MDGRISLGKVAGGRVVILDEYIMYIESRVVRVLAMDKQSTNIMLTTV